MLVHTNKRESERHGIRLSSRKRNACIDSEENHLQAHETRINGQEQAEIP